MLHVDKVTIQQIDDCAKHVYTKIIKLDKPSLKFPVRALSNEVIVLRNGRMVEQGPAADVFAAPRSDYTKALIAAAFDIEAAPDGVVST